MRVTAGPEGVNIDGQTWLFRMRKSQMASRAASRHWYRRMSDDQRAVVDACISAGWTLGDAVSMAYSIFVNGQEPIITVQQETGSAAADLETVL